MFSLLLLWAPSRLHGHSLLPMLWILPITWCHSASDSHWLPLTVTDYHWLPLTVTVCHWPPLTVTDCLWLPLTATVCLWPPLSATDSYCLPPNWFYALNQLRKNMIPACEICSIEQCIRRKKSQSKYRWPWRCSSNACY